MPLKTRALLLSVLQVTTMQRQHRDGSDGHLNCDLNRFSSIRFAPERLDLNLCDSVCDYIQKISDSIQKDLNSGNITNLNEFSKSAN